MTTITGDAGVGSGVAPSTIGPNKSYITVRPVEMVTTAGGVTMLPIASRHELESDGAFSIQVDPLPDGFAHEFQFIINGGEFTSPPRYCEVPTSGTVAFKDLVDVTPPDHGGWGVPGWIADLIALVEAGGGGGGGEGGPAAWGSITGPMSSQTDLAAALAALAPKASPALTGNPTAPTPSPGDNDTSIATTAFVATAIAALISSAPGALDTLDELAAALGDDANFAATITNALALKAPLASPVFTGNPRVPTAAPGDASTTAASTAFVATAIAALISSAPGALDTLDELAAALGDDANFAATITNALALKASLASPALTGNPTAPTPAPGDNDVSIATTAFVQTELTGKAGAATPGAALAILTQSAYDALSSPSATTAYIIP
ncbi:hypothetical protein LJR045_000999 [Microbacterium sp. LjRoot45]|uniref:phage upper tail fiber protein n=1 Tax=Microbacterium sp. LjRoot45 TaxID=3342329 RepID=UPI003ECD32DC